MSYQLFSEVVKSEYPQTDLAKSLIVQPNNSNETEEEQNFNIMKTDDEKRLIFGWANVAIRTDGKQVVDHQKDMIEPEDLEEAVYEYVLNFRDGGEEHIDSLRKKAKMIESCVFTKEKMQAMGIPAGIVPEGWWIGFYVEDDEAWEKVKDGTYQMFSIEGQGIREEVEETETLGKSDIDKFNPYHDQIGRFTSGNGGNVHFFTTQTKDPNKQHWADKAIYRAKQKDYDSKMKVYNQAKQEFDNAKTISGKAKLHDKLLAAAKDAQDAKEKLNNHKDLQPKLKETTKPPASEKPKTTGSKTTDPNDPKYLNKKKQKDHLPEQHLSQNQAIEITQKQTGTNYETAKRLAGAAYDFTGSQYGSIREAYSKGDTASDYGKKAQALDEFIQKSPKWDGGTLYRGIGVDKKTADEILEKAALGKPLDQRGPSSWSTSKNIASSFSDKGSKVRIMFITNNKNTKYGTSVKHLSQFPNEKEVLMSGKAKQRATDVKYDEANKIYQIFVDDI